MANTRVKSGWFCCLAFGLAVAAQPAVARPVPHANAPLTLLAMDSSYALVAGTAAAVERRVATPISAQPVELSHAITAAIDLAAAPTAIEGPIWTLKPRNRGPVFEVGALGAGQEWAPSLVHASVDWQF